MNYFIKRAIAYFVDCIIVFSIIMLVLQWAIFSQFRDVIGITDAWFRSSWNMQLYVLLSISIPVWLYFAYFDSKHSKGSFGKRLFKLSVKDNSGGGISFSKSLFRSILKLLPWEIAHIGVIWPTPIYFEAEPTVRILTIIGMALFLIYVFSILIDKDKRSLYDIVLNVNVVN